MSGKWLVAALAVSGLMFAAAPSPVRAEDAPTTPACGTADECLAEGDALAIAPGNVDTQLRLAFDAYAQACAWGSGLGCYNASSFAHIRTGAVPADLEASEQFLRVGCQLDHAWSCRDASSAAMQAGRKAEAWAYLALHARLIGRDTWDMDGAAALAPTLPDGRTVLPPNDGLAWAPEGVSTALTCAGYWQAISPDSPEAAGWKAAARAAFLRWPPLADEPARTAEEADQWIADQAVIWRDGEGSALDPYYQLTTSRCFMGRSRLLFLQ